MPEVPQEKNADGAKNFCFASHGFWSVRCTHHKNNFVLYSDTMGYQINTRRPARPWAKRIQSMARLTIPDDQIPSPHFTIRELWIQLSSPFKDTSFFFISLFFSGHMSYLLTTSLSSWSTPRGRCQLSSQSGVKHDYEQTTLLGLPSTYLAEQLHITTLAIWSSSC